MVSKPKVANAPGLELIQKADGSFYPLWRASREGAREGYFPKSMRLDFDVHDPETQDGIRHACQREQAALEQWFADRVRAPAVAETLKGLSRLYQTHEASTFRKVKFNTRQTYIYELRMIESSIGERRLERITASDFVRWHREAVESVEGGGIRKAQSLLKRLRAIISFGIVAEIDACHRLVRILDQMRFATPSRRRVVMTYDTSVAIIAKAHEMGRPSVALAQALQFETGLRQADVVGLWAPRSKNEKARFSTGLLKWDSGLCWEDIGGDMVLVLDTSKTGSTVTHDLAVMPLPRTRSRHGPSRPSLTLRSLLVVDRLENGRLLPNRRAQHTAPAFIAVTLGPPSSGASSPAVLEIIGLYSVPTNISLTSNYHGP